MIIPLENHVDGTELLALIVRYFPELAEDVEGEESNVFMQMAAILTLANRCIKSGDFEKLKSIYEFISDLSRHRSEIEPSVTNAIHVTFLERLNLKNKKNGARAKEMLPTVLGKMREAQMEYNKSIGYVSN